MPWQLAPVDPRPARARYRPIGLTSRIDARLLALRPWLVDTQIHPRPELTHLRALPMVLIETCSLPSQKDPGGHTIIPLPQIGRSAKDRDVVPE